MSNLMMFLGLMGILAGASGAPSVKGGTTPGRRGSLWWQSLAGFVHGIMLAALVYLVGTLNAAGVKMSAYLPQVLPEAIRQLLYGLTPLQAAAYFIWSL